MVGRRKVSNDPTTYRLNLTGANLTMANLTGANLTSAFLGGANLRDANLTGADGEADGQAKGLTQAQIVSALTDNTTKLPAGLKRRG